MTSTELRRVAVENLRLTADRIERGELSVARVKWEDTGNCTICGPDPINDVDREYVMSVWCWPVRAQNMKK